MPFIIPERRAIIDAGEFPGAVSPGDRCYVYYKEMKKQWKENPSWTTAHAIYADVRFGPVPEGLDNEAAKQLAWQVFFQLEVIPYELKKREENGDVCP